MEATGAYHEEPVCFLHDRNHTVHTVLPGLSKKYGQSPGLKSGTGRIDSRILSRLGLERALRVWKPVSCSLLSLKGLTREGDAPVRTRAAAANRLHAYRHRGRPCRDSGTRSTELTVFLDQQIKNIEKQFKNPVNADDVLKNTIGHL